MSEHKATIRWQRGEGDFLKGKFSREHTWTFDGGAQVLASAAPSVVPKPYSNEAGVDPEEALVASLSSCHMLTFVYLCSRQGIVVDSYVDDASGVMAKNEAGRRWISHVTLNPRIVYAGEKVPSDDEEAKLHHNAHEECFIANSVRTAITVNSTRG